MHAIDSLFGLLTALVVLLTALVQFATARQKRRQDLLYLLIFVFGI